MKISKNKWIFDLLAVTAMAAMFAACGENGTSENITNNYASGFEIVDSVAELPKCGKDNKGDQALVRGENVFRICLDGKWQTLKGECDTLIIAGDTIIVKDTLTIAGDTIIQKDTLVQYDTLVVNSRDTVYIDGVAMSCTTQELVDKSGFKILCNGDSIGVVLNGKDGEKGEPGKDGADGKPGTPGADGKPGVNGVDGSDGSDGKDGENGKDGVGCSIAFSTDSTVTIKCGEDEFIMNLVGASKPETPETSDTLNVVIKNVSITGVSQKGPFINGSKVTLYELDGNKSLAQTGRAFGGEITSDDGKFSVNSVTLGSSYAKLEAMGFYRNEVTGRNSKASITLNAYTDLRARKKVNLNLLTHLEYYRVNYLMINSDGTLTIKEVKKQAQKEIFKTVFGIDNTDFGYSEDMDIFGTTDGDAALLALSIMLQGDRSESELTALLTAFGKDIETDGEWGGIIAGNDTSWRDRIADWLADVDLKKSVDYARIRTNVENWGLGDVPDFEKYLRRFWNNEYGLGECNASVAGTVKNVTNKYSKYYSSKYEAVEEQSLDRFICSNKKDSSSEAGTQYLWRFASTIEKDTYGAKCPEKAYDLLDGVVTSNKYVCEGTEFRLATEREHFMGKICIEEIADMEITPVESKSPIKPFYTCIPSTGWVWNKAKNVYVDGLKDSRDEQTYDIVAYDNQVWMAENLNYDYCKNTAVSYVNSDYPEYGRYYTWAAAMDSAGIFSTNSKGCGDGKTCIVTNPARGVCPEGWHIPTSSEWDALYSFMGKSPYAMQATGFTNWPNATDAYVFSALPAGVYYDGSFGGVGSFANFWSATESNSYSAYSWYMYAGDADLYKYYDKNDGYSVRCLQD